MEQGLKGIFALFGGLALFLYGMDALSRSLETAAGQRMKRLLMVLAGSPVRGVLAGAAVTAVLQSSSAVTVMVLGFVSAGLLTLRQAVPMIFGCNIGTTVTAQLLAFRLEDVRGLVLLAGLLLCFACAGQKARAVGRAVFAFGLLFEGIAGMSTALAPLAQSPVFALWLARVRHRPWLGLLTGLCMTLTVQSSSATIAVLQSVAARPGPQGGRRSPTRTMCRWMRKPLRCLTMPWPFSPLWTTAVWTPRCTTTPTPAMRKYWSAACRSTTTP